MDVATAVAVCLINLAWAWYMTRVQKSLMEAHRETLGMVGNLVLGFTAPRLQSPPPPSTLNRVPPDSPLANPDIEEIIN